MTILTVGLLSDTHMPHRLKRLPNAALDALAGVSIILHAGDVDDPSTLESLREVAPVHAVRGNLHLQDLSDGGASLPAVIQLDLAGQQVVLTHGHQPGPIGFILKGFLVLGYCSQLIDRDRDNRRIARRLARLYPQADIIVFGHTHWPHVEWIGHTLMVNPGGICVSKKDQPTVALMRLGKAKPEVDIVPVTINPSAVPD